VDSFTRERVDETCGVADQNGASLGKRVARRAQRKPIAADVLESFGIKVERERDAVEVLSEPWPFALPADHAEFRCSPLGKTHA
jgi:hypothetical protein